MPVLTRTVVPWFSSLRTEKGDGEEKHSSGLVRDLLFSIPPYPVEDRGGWGFNRPLTSETGCRSVVLYKYV